jgi:hypothetical protein
MIGRTNVGGGSARINIANHAILPASGRDNQIALINSTAINDVYCQSAVPDNPVQGDIWIVVTTKGTAYLQFDTIKFFIASIRQYDNGAWTYISAWYVWQNNNWITGRLTLIDNGAYTGQAGITFAGRQWAKLGRTTVGTVTVNQLADCIEVDYLNTKTTSDTNGYAGICTSSFDVGAYANIHCEARFKWSATGDAQRADLMINNYNVTNPEQNALVYYTFKTNPSSNTWYYYDADIPIPESTASFCIYIGVLGLYYNRHHYIQIFNMYLE